MRSLIVLACLAACGSPLDDADDDDDVWTTSGECEAPAGATALAATAIELADDSCFIDASNQPLRLVGSDAEWNALFDCAQATPPGLDLATQRAAVIAVHCSRIYQRFAADTNDEIVIGVHTPLGGACLRTVLVVPLPRSAKPVRLAQCADECNGECRPVP